MNTYEKHILANPALPFIYHVDTIYSKHRMQRGNWHENIEILCFTEGEGVVRINAVDYSVCAGDIIVINSNCIHEFSSNSSMTYHCLIIDRSFAESNYFDNAKLHFSTHFRDESIRKNFEALSKEYSLDENTPWRIQTIRCAVLQILTELCKNHSEPYDQTLDVDARLLSCVKKAIGFIRSEYRREISLEEICGKVGLSKYYFAREFRRITGHTIVHYINVTRCENAKLLLCESDTPMSEIATLSGFADQAYFTRVFKNTIGMPPSEYRKEYSKSI